MRQKKYKCMFCPDMTFPANEYYMAQEHYWKVHDEMLFREDLSLGFFINGHDLSGRND